MNIEAKLLTGQVIRIDGHEQGSGKPVEWDHNIHFHKETYGKKGKRKYADLKINLHEDMAFSSDSDPQLINEIKSAFENPSIRDAFVTDFCKTIYQYQQNACVGTIEERLTNGMIAAQRILETFGFENIEYIGMFQKSFESIYRGEIYRFNVTNEKGILSEIFVRIYKHLGIKVAICYDVNEIIKNRKKK